ITRNAYADSNGLLALALPFYASGHCHFMIQVTLHLYRMGSTERLRYVHDVISSLTIAEVTPKVPVADMVPQCGVYHLRVDLGGARLSLLIGGLVESVGLHGIPRKACHGRGTGCRPRR